MIWIDYAILLCAVINLVAWIAVLRIIKRERREHKTVIERAERYIEDTPLL